MKILIILLTLYYSLFSDTIEMPLSRFAGLVASSHSINIVIDNSVDTHKDIFYIESSDKKVFMLDSFRMLLARKNYTLKYNKHGNFYYISKIKVEVPKSHFFKLDSPIFEDIKSTLEMLNVKFSYISNNNTLTYICLDSVHKDVMKLIDNNDDTPLQFMLKITILETNLNELKDRGVNLSAYTQNLSGTSQHFLQLLSMPYISSINVFPSSDLGISGVLRYLDENSYTDILSSPFFTVQSNKEIYFTAVENIPYKVSSSSVSGASQSNIENTEYRDVGLKIKILPKVVKDLVYIDLNLIVENIIDKSTSTPSTTKRELNNSFQLKRGSMLVLSGINQTEKQNHNYHVPFLNKIPLIGNIFEFKTIEEIEKTLTITIEIL